MASVEALALFWCRATHRRPMWPVNGMYRCSKCLRTHRVPWDIPLAEEKRVVEMTPVRRPRIVLKWEKSPATR